MIKTCFWENLKRKRKRKRKKTKIIQSNNINKHIAYHDL